MFEKSQKICHGFWEFHDMRVRYDKQCNFKEKAILQSNVWDFLHKVDL